MTVTVPWGVLSNPRVHRGPLSKTVKVAGAPSPPVKTRQSRGRAEALCQPLSNPEDVPGPSSKPVNTVKTQTPLGPLLPPLATCFRRSLTFQIYPPPHVFVGGAVVAWGHGWWCTPKSPRVHLPFSGVGLRRAHAGEVSCRARTTPEPAKSMQPERMELALSQPLASHTQCTTTGSESVERRAAQYSPRQSSV